jgi:hypothetical protein
MFMLLMSLRGDCGSGYDYFVLWYLKCSDAQRKACWTDMWMVLSLQWLSGNRSRLQPDLKPEPSKKWQIWQMAFGFTWSYNRNHWAKGSACFLSFLVVLCFVNNQVILYRMIGIGQKLPDSADKELLKAPDVLLPTRGQHWLTLRTLQGLTKLRENLYFLLFSQCLWFL